MSDATEFTIGSEVACSDGVCGELTRVVVDPIAPAVTHLVVEPRHRLGLGRLVPVDLVESAAGEVRLRCTTSQFAALEDAEEARFLPGAIGNWGYAREQMLMQPLFGLGIGIGMDAGPQPVIYGRVPAGEVEVERGEHVHAKDGPIGQVQGLVVDPNDHHVTHVLLDEGHLWGKKRVAIPITAVQYVKDGRPAEHHEGRGARPPSRRPRQARLTPTMSRPAPATRPACARPAPPRAGRASRSSATARRSVAWRASGRAWGPGRASARRRGCPRAHAHRLARRARRA
jgi:hypothetical protein